MGVPAEPKAFVPLLPYQREDVECDARFRWCCWSRQTGKSFTKSLRRILRGLERGRTARALETTPCGSTTDAPIGTVPR